MLTDIIGIAIGFSVVMLLLSLLVTSLSQATQAVLRLRGRNLRYGLAAALSKSGAQPDSANLNEAAELLNNSRDASLRRRANPSSVPSRILGPPVSWLNEDSLRSVLNDKAKSLKKKSRAKIDDKAINGSVDDVVDRFKDAEIPLRNRFEMIMRGVSLIWAVVVAAVFQLSTPELIKQISTDPAVRAQYMLALPQVTTNTNSQADIEKVEERVAALSRINISPMQYGWSFYTDTNKAPANIVGVLVTAVLLALGAPFWYSALETAVRWRDPFAPPKEKPDKNEQPAEKK